MNKEKLIELCKISDCLTVNPIVSEWFKVSVAVLEDKTNYQKHINENKAIYTPKNYKVERQQSTNVYKSAKNRQKLAKLLPASKALIFYIIFQLETNSDYVIIDKDEFMKENSISLNTYKLALNELINQNYIKPSDLKYVYFINPLYFFSGSRIKYYPKHVQVYRPLKPRV